MLLVSSTTVKCLGPPVPLYEKKRLQLIVFISCVYGIYIYIYMCVYIYIYTYWYTHRGSRYVHIRVSVYVCMYIYIYIYMGERGFVEGLGWDPPWTNLRRAPPTVTSLGPSVGPCIYIYI